jgi:hypothetical protein
MLCHVYDNRYYKVLTVACCDIQPEDGTNTGCRFGERNMLVSKTPHNHFESVLSGNDNITEEFDNTQGCQSPVPFVYTTSVQGTNFIFPLHSTPLRPPLLVALKSLAMVGSHDPLPNYSVNVDISCTSKWK